MKDEKKTKSRTFHPILFCLFLAVVFLTLSLHITAQEKPLFTGNSRIFNHYGDYNGLFSQGYWSRKANMSNTVRIEQIKGKPRVSAAKFCGEILFGIVGNVAGGYGGGYGGALLMSQIANSEEGGYIGLFAGYFAGATLGSALGVYTVGNSGNTKGSFGRAWLGSILGECAAIIVSLITQNRTVAWVSFITFPPICAALSFNSSLRYKSSPVSFGLLNFNKGEFKMGIPYAHIQPLLSHVKNVKPTVRFSVNLLNIVF